MLAALLPSASPLLHTYIINDTILLNTWIISPPARWLCISLISLSLSPLGPLLPLPPWCRCLPTSPSYVPEISYTYRLWYSTTCIPHQCLLPPTPSSSGRSSTCPAPLPLPLQVPSIPCRYTTARCGCLLRMDASRGVSGMSVCRVTRRWMRGWRRGGG